MTRHGVALVMLGGIITALPLWFGLNAIAFVWVGLSFLVVGGAYFAGHHGIFGKRPDGTLGPAAYALAPFVGLTWLSWRLAIAISRERATDVVAPDLVLARRLRPNEVPAGVEVIVDLTAELPESRAVVGTRTYHNLRILDASAPEPAAIESLLAALPPDKVVLVHCAQGHGRTGMFAACFLIHRGRAADAASAIAACVNARPGIRLAPVQHAFVRDFASRRAITAAAERAT